MANQDRVLLVEGETDQGFLIEVLKVLNLQVDVKVAPPKELGGDYNSKQGVLNYLPTLLNQLADGSLINLAVVVDADTSPDGGYQWTFDLVDKIVKPIGYSLKASTIGGLIFEHDDGLADFGLWVMPDNTQEGMLEDLLKECIHTNEQALFAHAQSVVKKLPKPQKFKSIHSSKAEIATWLAWQKKPGHGLYSAVTDQLLDSNKPLYADLIAWMKHIFESGEFKS